MNQQGQVTFRLILTTLVVVAMIGVGLFYTTIEVSDNYDRPRGTDFNETFTSFEENFDEITSDATDIRNSSVGTTASQETTSGFDFSDAVRTLKLIANFFTAIQNMMSQLATAIGIPAIFVFGFFAVIAITIVLLFLKAIFGVDP